MNKYDCKSEKTSSRTMGLIMLVLAVIIGGIGGVIIPVFGFLFAVHKRNQVELDLERSM